MSTMQHQEDDKGKKTACWNIKTTYEVVLIYIHSLPETHKLTMSNKCPLLNLLNTWHIVMSNIVNVKLDLYNYILALTYWSVQHVTIPTIPINAQIGNILRGRAQEGFKDDHWSGGAVVQKLWEESFFSSPLFIVFGFVAFVNEFLLSGSLTLGRPARKD